MFKQTDRQEAQSEKERKESKELRRQTTKESKALKTTNKKRAQKGYRRGGNKKHAQNVNKEWESRMGE
ncbi:hypothetical protein K457DRAFT_135026, partial [Linnemannia elongata AG-77]